MTLPKTVNNELIEPNATAWVAVCYFIYTIVANNSRAAAAQSAQEEDIVITINTNATPPLNAFAGLPTINR